MPNSSPSLTPPLEVPFDRFGRQWRDCREALSAAFEAVGASGRYVLGREVSAFEGALARFWGLRHGVGVGSGLDALEIALRALGCRAGDPVLTTPVSAFATTLAILKIGAVPVFAAIGPGGLIDLDDCERILQERPDIRFFLPVHLYGHSLDLDRLASLRDRYELLIVEDCAQAIGARWNGRMAGSVGKIAAVSFYPTKNLGAMGDGGAILTDESALANLASQHRDYGRTATHNHARIG
ncbi:MAG TPA: DegT/DnrJ/EryC1/StrS aminotransferase family protein, partial [Bryobacteraceae bacterium]|nr:DegT/DnrJ/EryC1/StrS aminotransferase family protein [Bryobacteraceae bacterium]